MEGFGRYSDMFIFKTLFGWSYSRMLISAILDLGIIVCVRGIMGADTGILVVIALSQVADATFFIM